MHDLVLFVEVISCIIVLHSCGVVDCMLTVFFPTCEEVAAKIAKTYNINLLGPPVEKIQHCQEASRYMSKTCNLLGNENFGGADAQILIYYYNFLSRIYLLF